MSDSSFDFLSDFAQERINDLPEGDEQYALQALHDLILELAVSQSRIEALLAAPSETVIAPDPEVEAFPEIDGVTSI